jgi:hypothetical protein
VTRRISIPQQRVGLFQSLMTVASLLLFIAQAHSQEALQMSLAGDLAAESQRQATSTIGYYNLLWGPVAWRFSSGLEVDYNDNVNLQSQNQEGDFIFRPNLNTQMHWPVTQQNSLDVSVGAGYSLYATHSALDQFYLNPGSGLSFNIYAGNCVINLHDRVSITQNSYQNPTAGNNGNYAQLQNAVGASLLCDLSKVVTQLGYDHMNNVSLGSSQQVPDSTSDTWFVNAGVRVLPEVTAGVEGGVGLISYDQGGQSSPTQPDATQWNAGVFCKAQVSQYINGRLDAGYTVYAPSSTAGFTNLENSDSLYFQLSISHEVNKYLNYSLSAGRSTESSLYGQPYNYYFVRLQPSWNILKDYQLSTPCFWEKGTQLYAQAGAMAADYDQYGAGINLGRAITQKLSGSLAYQFVKETSAQPTLNYIVNIVSLSFSYQF